MSVWVETLWITTLLGSALIAGVFFIFSNTVMEALARLPAAQGVIAMQSINAMVLNPAFLGVFTGTAACSLAVLGHALLSSGPAATACSAVAALLYLAGCFLVTGLGNVPLNEQLATLAATDPQAGERWKAYVRRWTRLNTIRTGASGLCALLLALALVTGHRT